MSFVVSRQTADMEGSKWTWMPAGVAERCSIKTLLDEMLPKSGNRLALIVIVHHNGPSNDERSEQSRVRKNGP